MDWGWDVREGFEVFAGGSLADGKETDPVHAYGREDGGRSVVGGVVVRDPNLPDLAGKYLFGDTFTEPIHAGTLVNGRLRSAPTSLRVKSLVSFGEDSCGRVYAVAIQGPVYRLSDSGACGSGPSSPGTPAPGQPSAGDPGRERQRGSAADVAGGTPPATPADRPGAVHRGV